ncbi:MAG: PspC domain-containing protein [Lachnospiraceae bacterium]|nr:PspC domain-containing protein [Lachnospiraceae bacterium]
MSNDYKELRKSATNKTLCGVCGGIGEYFKIDPTLIRLLWILISLSSLGLGIIGYFIAAVVIPEGTQE